MKTKPTLAEIESALNQVNSDLEILRQQIVIAKNLIIESDSEYQSGHNFNLILFQQKRQELRKRKQFLMHQLKLSSYYGSP